MIYFTNDFYQLIISKKMILMTMKKLLITSILKLPIQINKNYIKLNIFINFIMLNIFLN